MRQKLTFIRSPVLGDPGQGHGLAESGMASTPNVSLTGKMGDSLTMRPPHDHSPERPSLACRGIAVNLGFTAESPGSLGDALTPRLHPDQRNQNLGDRCFPGVGVFQFPADLVA